MSFLSSFSDEYWAERRARFDAALAVAESGDIDAQLSVAWEYACGELVDTDIVAAWHMFDRAAASENEKAIVHRARFLQLRHVPEGVRQLRALAARGNWQAQVWLGHHYQCREGRISKLRAVVWYGRAAKSGGGPVVALARLAQIIRVAPLRVKIPLVGYACVAFIAAVWRMTRDEAAIEPYQVLTHRLGSRRPPAAPHSVVP